MSNSEILKKTIVILSFIILEQTIKTLFISDPTSWYNLAIFYWLFRWALFKNTLENIVQNKTLFQIENKEETNNDLNGANLLTDNASIDMEIKEDESFNKLTYAFVQNVTFCQEILQFNPKMITLSKIKHFDLKPYVQTVCTYPSVLSEILNYVSSNTIQQIQTQFLISL